MTTKDKIEIVIRAAGIAGELLELVKSPGKFHAQLVMRNAAIHLMELDQRINELPED